MNFIVNTINKLKYLLLALLLIPFCTSSVHAARDLLGEIYYPAQSELKTTIDMGDNVGTVWRKVLKWELEMDFELKSFWMAQKPSTIVRFIRLFLEVLIALSVTMILYNGLMYIIQTWNWKEWKSLVKNVVYIVIWILVALLSFVIIRLIQSIPSTLNQELMEDRNNRQDESLLNSNDYIIKVDRWDDGD